MKKKSVNKNSRSAARVLGLLAVAAVATSLPLSAAAGDRDNRLFDTHTVVVGDDGRSSVMIQSDAEITIFQRTLDLPATGGFFKRANVWADRQDFRITSLNQQGLVFLGNERVGTFPIPGGEVGDVLFQFTEHGHTLRIVKAGDLPPPDAPDAVAGTVVDVKITRP